ncbi:FAD-linked oxidase-like protein [Coprinellus micaceus]|uniref:D-lactate dehydrogenase (cytochrome) n=1 Tax=Coprinellus micaceus TaxID=71717 RepID=A0A4Y7RIW1_COPMI|nr:FAD-linked oxidase-like protein [Coprinellus micaceus]
MLRNASFRPLTLELQLGAQLAPRQETGADAVECICELELQPVVRPFQGSNGTRTFLQAITYAVIISGSAAFVQEKLLVRPHTTEDVVKIVNVARKYNVPLVPYSGATSLEGHFAGYMGFLHFWGLSTHLQCRFLVGTFVSTCPGWTASSTLMVGGHQPDPQGKGIPLFFPLDPGPGATIGGMIGTGCSGTNAVRYGTARSEWFISITAVLPDGSVVKTRSRARKSSAGFDTTKLFIGAEGTLGIVTEAPVVPTKVAMAQFPSVQHANASSYLTTTIQGDTTMVKETAKTVKDLSKKHGSTSFAFAASDAEADEMWTNRKYALMSTVAANPGYKCWTTDVCVPVSRLPELVQETKKDLAEHKLRSTIVGHVGDGNFHALILFKDDDELKKVEDAVHRLHGVGVGKKIYLNDELGESTVALLRKKIKKTIDPQKHFEPRKGGDLPFVDLLRF